MKSVLVKALTLAGILVGITGCNNTIGAVGFPTVSIGGAFNTLAYDKETALYKGTYTITATPLPGSPGGVVRLFSTQSGGFINFGQYIPKCEVPTTITPPVVTCPVVTTVYAYLSPLPPASVDYTLISYTAEGDNGIPATRPLGTPQPLI